MAINLVGLPQAWRVPGTYISNVPRNGGATVGIQPTMIIGQMQSAVGTATAGVPIPVFSYGDAKTLFGPNSMLANMFLAYRLNDPTGAVMVCPIQDNAGGSISTFNIQVTGTATSNGVSAFYINNVLCAGGVSSGDTAAQVATKLGAAIQAQISNPNVGLPVTVAVVSGLVTVNAVHKGQAAGDLLVSQNKNGFANGESTPSGVNYATSAVTAGATDPDLTATLAAIRPLAWSYLINPYTNSTAMGLVNTMLSDTVGRWSPSEQTYGVTFSAARAASVSAMASANTFGSSKHQALLGVLDSQTPTYISAAIFGGLAAMTSRSGPALPIVGPLQGMDSPSVATRLRRVDENTLLFAGVTPVRVDRSGSPFVPRIVQTYTTDTNYLNIETDLLVAYVDMFIRSDLENSFAQVSLVADGNPVAAGSGATTPKLVLSHVWSLYLDLEAAGIVQNSKAFIAASYAEADLANGVVSLYLPVQTAGQLRQIRILNSFS